MIAKLRGRLDSLGEATAVIDVGGVGYLTHCSARTLTDLPAPGAEVELLVQTEVREDAISLYGFLQSAERDWFRLLTTVQGVGARVALAILSALGPEEIGRAILAEDKAMLTRADGVGPKLAVRILTELKEKAAGIGAVGGIPTPMAAAGGAPGAGPLSDAVSALVNLGYGRAEAHGAVGTAAQALGPEPELSGLIAAALKELGR